MLIIKNITGEEKKEGKKEKNYFCFLLTTCEQTKLSCHLIVFLVIYAVHPIWLIDFLF